MNRQCLENYKMGWLPAVALVSVLALAGCYNSSNPAAPLSTAPHEKGWVASHRNDIVSGKGGVMADGSVVQPGILIAEHVTQCQVCHGAEFRGANSGAAGPACLDCHVLDPGKYPVMCYSCHGFPVMTTQQWYSTNQNDRPGYPLGSGFSDRVNNNPEIHLKHKTLNLDPNGDQSSDACAVCHGDKGKRGVKHHEIVMGNLNMGCLGPLPNGCHTFNFSTFTLETPVSFVSPNCSNALCHSQANLP